MLIEMNIMKSEQINIIISKKQIIIDICQNTVISIEIHLQSSFIKHIIHVKFNIVISSHTKQLISVHHIRHLPEQDFLFKSKDSSNLVLYAYMIDFSLSVIITQNKLNQPISIRHNQRLEHFTELNYEECYHVVISESTQNLAIQRSAVTH